MHSVHSLFVTGSLIFGAFSAPADPSPNLKSRSGDKILEQRDCIEKYDVPGTKTYGDFEGCESSYSDGSGQKVRTDDKHKYTGDPVKSFHCWTDLVRPLQFYPILA